MRTGQLLGVFLLTWFGLLLEVAPQFPLQGESEPAISVLAPTTQVVFRGVQPIWKIQTDSPNELYLLNIEWYPVNVAEHTGAEYKPIPAPEIRIRKADSTGNPGQEIYFDLSAVVSSVDAPRVIVPLKSSSQVYFLTMISRHADYSLSVRLSSPYLTLLPVGSETTLATEKSSISVHVESVVPDERYCLVVSVCEGKLKAGSVGGDGGNIFGFRGKEGVHYVPFIAKANTQNKIVLVNNGPGLVVSSAKIMRLVAGAKIEEIARRQSLLEAETASTPNLPSVSAKQTGTLQFELTVGQSAEAGVMYSVISSKEESAIQFRAHCSQDQNVFLYTSLTASEKLKYHEQKSKELPNTSNSSGDAQPLTRKVQLGSLTAGKYFAANGHLTKEGEQDSVFMGGVLDEQEFYYVLQGKGSDSQHSKILPARPDLWWSASQWIDDSSTGFSRLLMCLAWIAMASLVCYLFRRQKSIKVYRGEVQGNSSELHHIKGSSPKIQHIPVVKIDERETTELSDPEEEQI